MEIFTPLTLHTEQSRSAVWIEVNLPALRANLQSLKGFLSPPVAVMAVVKANAYGHGLVPVAKALADGVEWFGVASLKEGVELRKNGVSQPILLFGHLAPEEIQMSVEWDLALSVSDTSYAQCVHETALKAGAKARVHVKVDTGMGRFGYSAREAEREILGLSRLSHLDLEGIYTHFAQAEKKADPFTLAQVDVFSGLVERLRHHGLKFRWVHAAGSSAVVNYPESHFNLVRPGLMVYGLYPDPPFRQALSLQPALCLRARWVLIKKMCAGETVGYGRSYVCSEDTHIGVLPVGYSHGYAWNLQGKSHVLYRSAAYPIVGRISMDSMTVDLGSRTEASLGDTATLIGREGELEVSAEDLALKGGTISYEVVTRLIPTMERVYLG